MIEPYRVPVLQLAPSMLRGPREMHVMRKCEAAGEKDYSYHAPAAITLKQPSASN